MSVRFCPVGFVFSCRIAWRFVAYATRSSMSLGSSSGYQCNTTLGHVDAPRPCSTHQSEGAQKNQGLNLKQGPRIFGISQAIYETWVFIICRWWRWDFLVDELGIVVICPFPPGPKRPCSATWRLSSRWIKLLGWSKMGEVSVEVILSI